MPLVPHIVGQHKAGEALVGYEITDAVVMRKPRLRLLGGAATAQGVSALMFAKPRLNLNGRAAIGAPPPGPRFILTPKLNLLAHPILLEVSQTFTITANGGYLYLLGKPARGREAGMVPTTPGDGTGILIPTDEEDFILIPTTEEHWVLVPTVERSM